MRIVLYADFLSAKHLTVTGAFYKDLVLKTARQHTDDAFILITNKPHGNNGEFPPNVTIYIAKFYAGNIRAFRWINKYLVSKTLKRLQADLFVTANWLYADRYKVPCCLLLLQPLTAPRHSGANGSLNLQSNAWIQANKPVHAAMKKAHSVIVFSGQYAGLVQYEFHLPLHKINWLPMDTVEQPGVATWEEKELAKSRFTAGAEYFLFTGDIHHRFDLVGLLKAFSLFKKWQQSGMHLVIAGSRTSYTDELLQKLSTFKYRKEVRLITDPGYRELVELTGSAYACVYPALDDHFPLPVLSAMRSGIPVITYEKPFIKDMAGDTVVYAKPNVEGLSASMQAIYKDEGFRARLIESATLHLAKNYQTDLIASFYGVFQNSLHSKS